MAEMYCTVDLYKPGLYTSRDALYNPALTETHFLGYTAQSPSYQPSTTVLTVTRVLRMVCMHLAANAKEPNCRLAYS